MSAVSTVSAVVAASFIQASSSCVRCCVATGFAVRSHYQYNVASVSVYS
jgi:hypothetical protein